MCVCQRERERQTDRQTDRQRQRQTDRQTDRQTEGERERISELDQNKNYYFIIFYLSSYTRRRLCVKSAMYLTVVSSYR